VNTARPLLLALLTLLHSDLLAAQEGGAPAPTRPSPHAPPAPSGDESFESVRDRIRAFQHESPEVRLSWIRQLGRFADGSAANLLLELLASEKTPALRTEIVRLLGAHGGSRVLAALLRELDATRDPVHLEAAAVAAARAGEGGAAAVLSRWEEAKDARTREALLRALGRSGAPSGLPVLLRVFDEGTPVDKLRVLESLRGQPATPAITKRRRAALADKFGALRAEAMLQLGADGDPAAKTAARAAAKSSDTRLRTAAATALAAGLTERDLPVWMEAASLPAGDLLPGIEETFQRIREDPPMLAWVLQTGIVSNNPATQALSVRILTPVPGKAATDAIVAAAGKPDALVAETALRALAARKDPAALEPARKLFAEPKSPERRASILQALHALCRDERAGGGS
jgi:HEAT repeat protein